MNDYLVSIIIPTYRRPRLLRRAIQSALNQSINNLTVIVCDNASGDETAEVVRSFSSMDPLVEYHCHEHNLGMLANYQFGLSKVDTEFFSFLSDDDVLLPWYCEEALRGFKKYPEIAFFAASTVIYSHSKGVVRVPLSLWKREGVYAPSEGLLEMIGKFPVPTTVLFKTERIQGIRIDENNPYMWDCDFLLQIAGKYPIAISKKECGIFLNHDESTTGKIDFHNVWAKALKRIEERVLSFSFLDERTRRKALTFISQYFSHSCSAAALSYLLKRKFVESYQAAQLAVRTSDQSLLPYLIMSAAKLCRIFPPLYYLLFLLQKMRTILKRIYWRRAKHCQNDASYRRWLAAD